MMKSIWTAVFSVGVSSCFAMAEDPKPATHNPAEKVINLYNQYMDAADWHMAELIALGAREKYGDDEPIIQRMLAEVAKAKASQSQPAPTFEFSARDTEASDVDRLVETKQYSIADLVAGEKSEETACDSLAKKVRFMVGEDFGSGSSASLFFTNRSLIVSTTQEKHDQVATFLAERRAAKKAEAAAEEPMVTAKSLRKGASNPFTIPYTKAYPVADVPLVAQEGFPVGSQELMELVNQEIGAEVAQKTDFHMAPYAAQGVLIVKAPQGIHDRIAEILKKMRAKNAVAPLDLESSWSLSSRRKK